MKVLVAVLAGVVALGVLYVAVAGQAPGPPRRGDEKAAAWGPYEVQELTVEWLDDKAPVVYSGRFQVTLTPDWVCVAGQATPGQPGRSKTTYIRQQAVRSVVVVQ